MGFIILCFVIWVITLALLLGFLAWVQDRFNPWREVVTIAVFLIVAAMLATGVITRYRRHLYAYHASSNKPSPVRCK